MPVIACKFCSQSFYAFAVTFLKCQTFEGSIAYTCADDVNECECSCECCRCKLIHPVCRWGLMQSLNNLTESVCNCQQFSCVVRESKHNVCGNAAFV